MFNCNWLRWCSYLCMVLVITGIIVQTHIPGNYTECYFILSRSIWNSYLSIWILRNLFKTKDDINNAWFALILLANIRYSTRTMCSCLSLIFQVCLLSFQYISLHAITTYVHTNMDWLLGTYFDWIRSTYTCIVFQTKREVYQDRLA